LDALGIPFGLEYRPSTDDNPKGYFECMEGHAAEARPVAMHTYIRRRMVHRHVWGWKPGSFLGHAHQTIPLLPNPHFILSRRRIDEQLVSFRKSESGPNMGSLERMKAIIPSQEKKLAVAVEKFPSIEVWYHDLMEDPWTVIRDIAQWLDFPTADIEKAVAHIDPKLWRVRA
jgi:hypothetical protein